MSRIDIHKYPFFFFCMVCLYRCMVICNINLMYIFIAHFSQIYLFMTCTCAYAQIYLYILEIEKGLGYINIIKIFKRISIVFFSSFHHNRNATAACLIY